MLATMLQDSMQIEMQLRALNTSAAQTAAFSCLAGDMGLVAD